MRRFIAYSTLAATMLVAVAVSATPVFTDMSAGNEFVSGHEISFKISEKGDNTQITYSDVDDIVSEMRSRLDSLDIEDYTINTQRTGNTADDASSQYITVSMSCEKNTFNQVCRLLTFSGQNFTFSSGTQFKDNVIKNNEAYITQYKDIAPFVVIPLTDSGKDVIKDYIDKLSTSEITDDSGTTQARRAIEVRAHDDEGNPTEDELNSEGNEAEQKPAEIFLWGNHDDYAEENIEKANEDPEIANKIILSFNHEDIYLTEEEAKDCGIIGYDFDDDTSIKYYCSVTSESEIKDANFKASLYLAMLKAKEYKFDVSCPTVNITVENGYDYFTNSLTVKATSEELLVYKQREVAFNTGAVLISTLLIIVIISIALAVYYRFISIGMIATTLGSLFLSFLAFIKLGALFNIPAIIGGIIVALGSLLSEIFYATKFKEEVLKGRNLKKANQEASKKSNLITIDVAVISMITGLMSYLLGGVSLKPLGVILFFGSMIALAMNLTIFKLLMHLLTNSTSFQTNYKVFNIDEKSVPNLMLEQKPTYVAPFENVDFTKPKKIAGIVLAALSALSLVGILVFGIKDSSPLNVAQASKDTAVVYVQFEKNETDIVSTTTFKKYVLKDIDDGGEEIPLQNISLVEVTKYDADAKKDKNYYYFTVKLQNNLTSEEISDLKTVTLPEKLADAEGYKISNAEIEVLNSKQLIYTPNQGLVALATGISIVVVTIYFVLRFRPSRGLAAGAITLACSMSAYGLFALVRIGTTAVTSLAMPIVAFASMFGSLMYFVIEKAIFADNREDLTPEIREQLVKKALGKAALPFIIFNVLMAYIILHLFGLGLPSTTALFGASLIGELITIASIAILLGPLSEIIAKWLGKITLPKIKKEKKAVQFEPKQKSSEPEETIFIGIND